MSIQNVFAYVKEWTKFGHLLMILNLFLYEIIRFSFGNYTVVWGSVSAKIKKGGGVGGCYH